MSLYRIKWTQFAVESLERIRNFIAVESSSEHAADRYVIKLIDRVEQLKFHPRSGQEELFLKKIGQNSRYLLEGNYKIIYQIEGNTVFITDIFHTKQNPKHLPKRNKKK